MAKKEMTMDAKLDMILSKIEAIDARVEKLEGKATKPTKDAPKSKAKKASAISVEDFPCTEWGNRKGKGYTAQRKAYAYAKCAEKGVKYDKDIFDESNAEYKDRWYDTLK